MMNFLYRTQDPMLQTLLTQRVLRYIAITNTFPNPAVSTAYSLIPVVLLVAAVLHSLVFLAEPSFRQPGASRVRTGTLWFPWHPTPSFGQKESPLRIAPTKAVCPYAVFDATIIPCPNGNFISESGHHGLPNKRTVRFSKNLFFRLYADALSI